MSRAEADAIRRLGQAIDVFLCRVGGAAGGRMRRYDKIRDARRELENETYETLADDLGGFDLWPDKGERARRLEP